jgi:hypothetical protein
MGKVCCEPSNCLEFVPYSVIGSTLYLLRVSFLNRLAVEPRNCLEYSSLLLKTASAVTVLGLLAVPFLGKHFTLLVFLPRSAESLILFALAQRKRVIILDPEVAILFGRIKGKATLFFYLLLEQG